MLKFTMGIELEYRNDHYSGWETPGWEKAHDSGLELRTGILKTYDQLLDCCKTVQTLKPMLQLDAPDYNADVPQTLSNSNSRGMHIHIGVTSIRDFGAKHRIFRALLHLEEAFFALAKPYPLRQRYCKKFDEPTVKAIKSRDLGWTPYNAAGPAANKYQWVNTTYAFHKHGTFEFRLFNSTKEAKEVFGWACLIQCVFEAATFGKLKFDWDSKATGINDAVEAFTKVMEHCENSPVKTGAALHLASYYRLQAQKFLPFVDPSAAQVALDAPEPVVQPQPRHRAPAASASRISPTVAVAGVTTATATYATSFFSNVSRASTA